MTEPTPETVQSEEPPAEVPASEHVEAEASGNQAQMLINCFLLLILGFIVYHNALRVPLQGADLQAFADGTGLSRVVTWPAAQAELPHGPFTLFMMSVNSVIGGGSVPFLHAGSLVLHLLNAMLLYLVVRLLLRGRGHELTAAVSGFVLLVHPAATQGVIYLVDRPVLQGTLFGLLALIAWLKGTEREDTSPRVSFLLTAGMLYIAAVASCTLLIFLPLVGLAVRLPAFKDPALAGGALFLMLLAAGSLWAADSLVQAGVLIPALTESIFALVTFQPSEIVPVGAPPHWAAWMAYLLVAVAGASVPVLLSRVNAAGGRAAAGVVLGVGILVMAVLSYQRTGAWQTPEDLWGQYADDAGALETLGRYYRHAAAGAPDNDETLALLRRAADKLDQATRLDPENGARHALLGQTLLELGDVQGANASLRAALRHAPFHRDAHLALSQLLATRAATTGDMTVLEEARRHLEAASAVAPLERPYQLQQAGMLLQLGHYREAAELIAAIPEEALPEGAGTLLQQARAATGRVQQLRQNALQNAGDATAAVGQAEAALLEGKLQSAYYMLKRFMQQAPDNANAWELLGVVKAEAGETETFISKWGSAPAASGEGWRRIATRVLAGGNWDAAAVFLAQSTGTDPKALETRLALAEVGVAANRLNEAGRVLQQAAEAFPDSPAPWLALAEIAEQLQQGDAAERFRGEAKKRQGSAGDLSPPTQEVPNKSNSTTTPQLPPVVEIR